MKSSKPRDVVLIITTPGLKGQEVGCLTCERYNYDTLFLDDFRDSTYIVFQRALTGEETVRAKSSLEGYASKQGVTMTYYHMVNGIFTK